MALQDIVNGAVSWYENVDTTWGSAAGPVTLVSRAVTGTGVASRLADMDGDGETLVSLTGGRF
jgi:hypothetical protein